MIQLMSIICVIFCLYCGILPPGGGGGGGVLGISSDGDDKRIFLGLKFLIPGFFC